MRILTRPGRAGAWPGVAVGAEFAVREQRRTGKSSVCSVGSTGVCLRGVSQQCVEIVRARF